MHLPSTIMVLLLGEAEGGAIALHPILTCRCLDSIGGF